jgi:DNA-binding NarL/FixJ family response regulator
MKYLHESVLTSSAPEVVTTCLACGRQISAGDLVSFSGMGAGAEKGSAIQLHAACTAMVAAELLAALSPVAGVAVSRRAAAVSAWRDEYGLTGRERAVLRGIVEGKTNAEMAAEMGLTVKTVKNVVSSVLFKLEARSRTEAAVVALRRGLVE